MARIPIIAPCRLHSGLGGQTEPLSGSCRDGLASLAQARAGYSQTTPSPSRSFMWG